MVTAVCGGIVTSLLRGGGPKRWASPVAWLGDLEAANDVVPDLAVWVEVAVDDTESRYSRASESDGENALLGDVWRAGVFAAPRLARVGEDGALAARCGSCDRLSGAGVFDRPFAGSGDPMFPRSAPLRPVRFLTLSMPPRSRHCMTIVAPW